VTRTAVDRLHPPGGARSLLEGRDRRVEREGLHGRQGARGDGRWASRFVAELPPDIRAGHDPHTVAQALAATTPDRAPDVVAAFVTAADAGLRVIGWSVLVIGGLVLLESLLSRRRRPDPGQRVRPSAAPQPVTASPSSGVVGVRAADTSDGEGDGHSADERRARTARTKGLTWRLNRGTSSGSTRRRRS
jgi:hypothetical protein